MTDLELIQGLEQHAGFVYHRLTCDGNIYAKAINLDLAGRAFDDLVRSFIRIRESLNNIEKDDKYSGAVCTSMNSFKIEDWEK